MCISDREDDSVKEYLRMLDDQKLALKKVKQQINAFCLRPVSYTHLDVYKRQGLHSLISVPAFE